MAAVATTQPPFHQLFTSALQTTTHVLRNAAHRHMQQMTQRTPVATTNLTQRMGLLDASCCCLQFAAPQPLLPLLLLTLLHELDSLLDAACQLWQHFVVVLLFQVVHRAQWQELLNARPA